MLSNRVLSCSLICWIVAQGLKVLLNWRKTKKFDFKKFFAMGGMPSSHSAFVVSMAVMTGIAEGTKSSAFAIAVCLAFVVLYDAMGVRYETGKQGKTLNIIIKELMELGTDINEEKLMEIVGHTPIEVFFGSLIGVIVPIIYSIF